MNVLELQRLSITYLLLLVLLQTYGILLLNLSDAIVNVNFLIDS